ncbi:50S ribosomal protein L6 [Alphaproteobacteria bacterium]|nr:50S ribosomal protein L6 [Alphaproteobacteria bacterium]GHS95639.1 50S ribosomal protein L6 [Alphaproteobacteria bacterium]
MSRVGKHEIEVPSSVKLLQEGNIWKVEGKLGKDSLRVPDCLEIAKTEKGIKVSPREATTYARSMWGTIQRSLSNMIKGVSEGFTVDLELIGVGYKATLGGEKLTLQLGFSHDIEYVIPERVTIKCEKPTTISITASSKQKAGAIAAFLRSYRQPEPYKGKGVIRTGEFVVRKEGKKK